MEGLVPMAGAQGSHTVPNVEVSCVFKSLSSYCVSRWFHSMSKPSRTTLPSKGTDISPSHLAFSLLMDHKVLQCLRSAC